MEREEWNRRAPLPSFLPSPSEPEELAAELRALPSHYRYFSDTLNADDYYRMVAEALIARGYSKRSSPSSSEPKDCSTCDGRGWLPETVCCGNTSDSGGACKGECAEQIQSMCADCEGSGKELPASPSSSEASGDTALLDKLESYGCIEIDKWQSGQRKGVALWFRERKIGAGDDLRTAITYAELPDGSPAVTARSSPSSARPPIAEMVRAWRDLDRRIEAEEITTAKAAELFVAEFSPSSAGQEVRAREREAFWRGVLAQRLSRRNGDWMMTREMEYPALSAGETETRT